MFNYPIVQAVWFYNPCTNADSPKFYRVASLMDGPCYPTETGESRIAGPSWLIRWYQKGMYNRLIGR